MRRAIVLSLLVSKVGSAGGTFFEQDFEAVGSDSLDGGWDNRVGTTEATMVRSAQAARFGTAGLHIERAAALGTGGPIYLEKSFSGTGPNFYVRHWVRLQQPQDQIYWLHTQSPNIGVLAGPSLRPSADGGFQLQFDASDSPVGDEFDCPTRADLSYGAWHDVEFLIQGLGTATASAAMSIDGVVFCMMGIDWSDGALQSLRVGQPGASGAGAFIDLDSVVLATDPLPSRLELDAGSADAGCVPVWVAVTSTFPNAIMPATVTPAVTSTDGDGQPSAWCSGPGVAVLANLDVFIPLGEVRPRGATHVVATYDGLMDGVLDLLGPPIDSGTGTDGGIGADGGTVADGGADGGPGIDAGQPPLAPDGGGGPFIGARLLDLSCGCGAAPSAAWLAAMLAVMRRRRGRRQGP